MRRCRRNRSGLHCAGSRICNKVATSVLLVAAVLFPSVKAEAETVSQKQASKIAATFFNTAYGIHVAAPKLAWNGRQLTTNRLFNPFYVYNHPKGGFVIVSAENKAFPILGYSLTNNFRLDGVGEEEKELFTQFAREIELIRYDTRLPERAEASWQNLPEYITGVLNKPYDTPEFRALTDSHREGIERIDRKNGWIVMPSAVEFEIYNPDRYRNYVLDDALAEEEIPFSFYENFIKETEDERREREAKLEELINPSKPVVTDLGGAHFAVTLPKTAKMLRVYGIDGSRKLEKYFKETEVVNIDISSLPVGYYVAMILTDDGYVYGIKLYRI